MIQDDMFGQEVRVLVTLSVTPDTPDDEVPKRRAELIAREAIDTAMTYQMVDDGGIRNGDCSVGYVGSTVHREGSKRRKKPSVVVVDDGQGAPTKPGPSRRPNEHAQAHGEIQFQPSIDKIEAAINGHRNSSQFWMGISACQAFLFVWFFYWMVFT